MFPVMLVQMNSYQTGRDEDRVLQLLFALDYLTVCLFSLAAHTDVSHLQSLLSSLTAYLKQLSRKYFHVEGDFAKK